MEYQTGQKGASYYQRGTMQVTVTKIVKVDPKVFSNLSNKDEFKDLVPYYIFTASKILTYQGKPDGNTPNSPIVYGVLKDGTASGRAIGLGSLDGCDDKYFDEPKVGATAVNCTVALAKASGAPVVGAVYEGDFDLYPSSTANPYSDNPIVWLP